MVRSILGAIAGVVVAFTVVMLWQMGVHQLFPPPPGDYTDPAVQAAAMAAAPAGALVLVAVGYAVAALAGGFCAALAAARRGWPAAVPAVLLTAGTIANVTMLTHPMWFTVLALVLIVAAGAVAFRNFGPARTA